MDPPNNPVDSNPPPENRDNLPPPVDSRLMSDSDDRRAKRTYVDDRKRFACCDRCFSDGKRGGCPCLIPSSRRKRDLGPGGCKPCGCYGCHPTDKIPPPLPPYRPERMPEYDRHVPQYPPYRPREYDYDYYYDRTDYRDLYKYPTERYRGDDFNKDAHYRMDRYRNDYCDYKPPERFEENNFYRHIDRYREDEFGREREHDRERDRDRDRERDRSRHSPRKPLANGCCQGCMKAFAGKACACQVPAKVRKANLENGCNVCHCKGCSPHDTKK